MKYAVVIDKKKIKNLRLSKNKSIKSLSSYLGITDDEYIALEKETGDNSNLEIIDKLMLLYKVTRDKITKEQYGFIETNTEVNLDRKKEIPFINFTMLKDKNGNFITK
ncbi:MAG: hypothetical protein QXL94_00805 [Candidatus Parvarchaeum sp.]